MKHVWKWTIPVVDYHRVEMPSGTRLLSAQEQHGHITVWGLADSTATKVTRHLRLCGTGHPMNDEFVAFVGTIQQHGGQLVWHLFDLGETPREDK